MSAATNVRELLEDAAKSYRQDADVLERLAESHGDMTGAEWAMVYRAVAAELRKVAPKVGNVPCQWCSSGASS